MSKSPSIETDRHDWLQHQWVVAGVIVSAARFVPIPFVDDVIRSQCRRFVVSRTLNDSGSTLATSDLKPFYGGSGGCVVGCLGMIAKAPFKLLLFPIRKIVSMATSIRGVPLEIMQTVLLGRTLRRQLADKDFDPRQADLMRAAFDESFARMDFHAVRAAITDVLREVQGWKSSAIESARKVSSTSSEVERSLPTSEGVESTATTVQQVLERPETAKLFDEFDRRFDAAFSRLRSARGGIQEV